MVLSVRARKVLLGTLTLAGGQPKGTVLYLDSLVNAEKAMAICFYLHSSLSVSVNVQAVGSESPDPRGGPHYDIGDCLNLPPGNVRPQHKCLSLGFQAMAIWHPYVGIDLYSQSVAASSGQLLVTAVIQEWVDVSPEGIINEPYDPAKAQHGGYQSMRPGGEDGAFPQVVFGQPAGRR